MNCDWSHVSRPNSRGPGAFPHPPEQLRTRPVRPRMPYCGPTQAHAPNRSGSGGLEKAGRYRASSPLAPMHDFLEGPTVRSDERPERPVGRVTKSDQVLAAEAVREPQHATRPLHEISHRSSPIPSAVHAVPTEYEEVPAGKLQNGPRLRSVAGRSASSAGRTTTKAAPLPRPVLSACTVPPCSSTM